MPIVDFHHARWSLMAQSDICRLVRLFPIRLGVIFPIRIWTALARIWTALARIWTALALIWVAFAPKCKIEAVKLIP